MKHSEVEEQEDRMKLGESGEKLNFHEAHHFEDLVDALHDSFFPISRQLCLHIMIVACGFYSHENGFLNQHARKNHRDAT